MLRHTDKALAFPFDAAPRPDFRFIFTDADDVRWQLDEHQRLTEIPTNRLNGEAEPA
jgi:hypothetical protein